MNKIFQHGLLALSCLAALTCFGGSAQTAPPDDCDVATVDARMSKYEYRPGQVIVKFKETSAARVRTSRQGPVRSGVAAVDNVFRTLGVRRIEALMPLTGAETFARRAKAFNGTEVATPSMERAFLVEIAADHSVEEAVEILAAIEDVEYAEPNYVVRLLTTDTDINDPYYSLQYGLKDINIYPLWGQPVLSKEGVVIGIIDTGVDIMHPDLKDNIWTNPKEGSGVTDYDDDNNGYVDDLHGYDFVNQTGVIADYNGHGTHCAGIAGACGNNGIGITGANPNARIMPLTAMQSNGTGDVGTIIMALDYAVANGAQVISMSFGTYAHSIAFEQALGRAYQKAVLVAAAGNDGRCVNMNHLHFPITPAPMFPAAYTFVLGVQASKAGGGLADFSNYDDDGPTYSPYSEDKLYNYELTAPGVGIMSTYPNGQYKQLNGTSMACPLVAGAVSRLLQSKEVTNKEEFFGDLINSVTPEGNLDIYRAYTMSDADRKPALQIINVDMIDADGDGRPDAGEILEFYPVVRNTWGTAANIRLELDCAETANTWCEFLTTSAEFGSTLSSYGKGRSANPLRIKLKDNVVNGRICRLKLTATCDNGTSSEQEIELTVENGVEIGGIIEGEVTLHAGVQYIVTRKLVIAEKATLHIEPGTVIKFHPNTGISVAEGKTRVYGDTIELPWNNIKCFDKYPDAGKIIAKGIPGKMIKFMPSNFHLGNDDNILSFGPNSEMEYCEFSYLSQIESSFSSTATNTFSDPNKLYFNSTGYFKNCIFNNIKVFIPSMLNYDSYLPIFLSTFYDNICNNFPNISTYSCNFVNNSGSAPKIVFKGKSTLNATGSNCFSNWYKKSAVEDRPYSVYMYSEDANIRLPEPIFYFGSARPDILRDWILDINNGFGTSSLDLSTVATRPIADAHGIVWKVVVDGYDALDEYDMLPPLGVGRHKFEVYFNRPMNKEKAPMVAMGVRAPYTQQAISEDGSWNEAGDIYTVYFTVTGKQNIDGVNRIYVAQAEDNEFFEIPVENFRFNVNVQAAGSLSTGFFGEAGLGRVNLAWEDLDMNFEDIMGYNMYRINPETEDTVKINDRLIEAGTTTFTDYDVVPGKTYRYYYKVMTTALKENDPSKTVAVTPLTSVQGDANGSGAVDVADVLTAVNYASGMEPKPFIFEAADMNSDGDIDIVDVVGIINVILGTSAPLGVQNMAEVTVTVKDGVVWVNTPVELAGVQFDITTTRDNPPTVLEALQGFETAGSWRNENCYRFIAYNLGGRTLAPGNHALLRIGAATVTDARISDPLGANVTVLFGSTEGVDVTDIDNNRVGGTLPGVYNIFGIKVGENTSDLERLPAGVYIVNGWKVLKR